MNIFFLAECPIDCSRMHVDSHVTKMILEYSQLLSTAHRVIDGHQIVDASSGRRIARWVLDDERENILYKSTHVNHPSAIWARSGKKQYEWLWCLLASTAMEFNWRRGKMHACQTSGLITALSQVPAGLKDVDWTEPTPAMPPEFIVPGNSVESYRNYYRSAKTRLHSWTKREVPAWIDPI